VSDVHRYQGDDFNENLCAQAVSERYRWPSFYQCTRRHRPGSDWCKQHDPSLGDSGMYLYVVDMGYIDINDPVMVKVSVAGETAKRYKLNGKRERVLDYRTTVNKSEMGKFRAATTEQEARDLHRVHLTRKLEKVQARLREAREGLKTFADWEATQ